jgi:membrane-bound lytic murein transglycosylase A
MMAKTVGSPALKMGLGLCLAMGLGLDAFANSGQAAADSVDSIDQQETTSYAPEASIEEVALPPLRLVESTAYHQILQEVTLPAERAPLLQAINYSLDYLATPKAGEDYQNYPVAGITRDRIWQSLQRLRQLIQTSPDDDAFRQALAEEFRLYQSIGNDGEGTVAFTGYFEPYYRASAVPTPEFRYPLYQRPADLDTWPLPHPTRAELEGIDGLQSDQGPLAGLELVWLPSRLEAFLVQVQGSAKLQLTDGRVMSVGYAGRTDYPYTSIGQALVTDGKIAAEDLSLPNLMAYFEANPQSLDNYIPKNQRFIFFRATDGGPPTGSLSVPVTAGVSIATDKKLMPPGAMALIQVPLPLRQANGAWGSQPTSRLVLDQDTGGAIIGPGRVDLFVGSGLEAGELAGRINTTGQLYYLVLR